jgi:Ni/Fe-hydrogenase 1 B-type cytochrome subunit
MATNSLTDVRHPLQPAVSGVAVYVWQYPIRLFHWGMVISIAVLSVTGYYIHDPYIVSMVDRPYMMGWFRFVHEACGMVFIALFLMRLYMFFGGNRWARWRQFVPLRAQQWKDMIGVMKFYSFMTASDESKIGHNSMAAFSYVGLYSLVIVEIVTGLVLLNWAVPSGFLSFLFGWIPRVVGITNLRLIHFFLMYVFVAFGIFHVYLCILMSRAEKRGMMDSILIGYKVIPLHELEQEEARAAAGDPL